MTGSDPGPNILISSNFFKCFCIQNAFHFKKIEYSTRFPLSNIIAHQNLIYLNCCPNIVLKCRKKGKSVVWQAFILAAMVLCRSVGARNVLRTVAMVSVTGMTGDRLFSLAD